MCIPPPPPAREQASREAEEVLAAAAASTHKARLDPVTVLPDLPPGKAAAGDDQADVFRLESPDTVLAGRLVADLGTRGAAGA